MSGVYFFLFFKAIFILSPFEKRHHSLFYLSNFIKFPLQLASSITVFIVLSLFSLKLTTSAPPTGPVNSVHSTSKRWASAMHESDSFVINSGSGYRTRICHPRRNFGTSFIPLEGRHSERNVTVNF